MGVYIKGLNKKDISDLRVHKYGGAYEYIDYKNIVEVKEPHGRLIDRQAIYPSSYIDDIDFYTKKDLDDAPTVIESEE